MLERVGILYRDFYQTKQCFGFNDGALRCLEQLELEPRNLMTDSRALPWTDSVPS
jgi:hypothetical protein